MNLKLKVLLISLAFAVGLGSISSVILEYSMALNTKKEIELAKRAEQAALEEEKALEAEKLANEEEKENILNSYDKVEDYYNGLALVKRDNKYGYIDINGNEVIALEYDMANNFTKQKYAKVKKDNKWGYIDTTGKAIIPIEYAYCGEVSYGIVAVGNGGKYGFMRIDGTEVCGLIYDKVEAFSDKGLAKVVLDKKYGFIDDSGKEVIEIMAPYKEENLDFTGEWKATNVHSSKAGTVLITAQTSTSFNFEILSKYFMKSGKVLGTADIIKSNVAEYNYNSGSVSDVITFSIIDGELIVSAKNDGKCDMDKELSVLGTYTLEMPSYTNSNVMDKLFDNNEKLFDRIKNALGEDVYESYFIYGFKNGEYKVKEIDEPSAVIKGTVYTVTVPTVKKDFKLLINKDNIYFFAKHDEMYITDDEARKSLGRMPSAIAFDEL